MTFIARGKAEFKMSPAEKNTDEKSRIPLKRHLLLIVQTIILVNSWEWEPFPVALIV